MTNLITRRATLLGIGGSGLMLSGCEKIAQIPGFQGMLESAEHLSRGGQRLVLTSSRPLAREYQRSDITRNFKANGTTLDIRVSTIPTIYAESISLRLLNQKREAYTKHAIDQSVFGAPFFVIDGERFWGQDRLDFVDRKLAA